MSRLPHPIGFQLIGKSALVVGGSSGLGLGAAVALADAGARVTLAARDRARLAEVQALMHARGWPVEIVELDITDTVKTAAIIAAHGPFDVLVNSAGLARHAPAQDTCEADFDAVMAVNLRGAYFVTQAVAKGLIAAKRGGSLINISSQMGHVGGMDRAVYCASKFAVEGFTKAMAIDWGAHNIRVNTICPTFVKTPLTQTTFDDPDKRAWILDKIKLGRAGEVADIMGAVVYLASEASAMVTGSALMIDGGWTAD
ncbi:MAG: SDR family oxidoreductase [Alphaproteobacteria bacterium]|nr:SDR family oxidoreductase [Alphaproteobacteria bacterium]